jgi:hypothetical protein
MSQEAAMRSRSLWCWSLGLSFALLHSPPTAGIVGGIDDGNDHPFVGIMAFQVEPAGPWYVGLGGHAVLVSPTVGVTAAHILTELPPALTSLGLTPHARGVVFEPEPVNINAPGDLGVLRIVPDWMVHKFSTFTWHPEFPATDGTDVGVVLFDEPVSGRTAEIVRNLDERLMLGSPASHRALTQIRTATLVGYGQTTFVGPPITRGGGKRRQVEVLIVEITPLKIAAGAPSGEGAGPGDSGSAAFLGRQRNQLVGVLSTFTADERSLSIYVRLDTETAQSFLSQFLR